MKSIATILAILMVVTFAGWVSAAEVRPNAATPGFDTPFAPPSKAQSDATMASRMGQRGISTASSSSVLAGNRLVALQHTDGGWGWYIADVSSPLNIIGPIGMGLAQAYQESGVSGQKTSLTTAGAFLLAKTNNFSPSDGYLAAQLDKVLGGTTYTTYVKTNYYDQLAAGTYNKNGLGTLYTTASYVALIRASRSGSQANIAAWDLGIGLVGASMCGGATADWITGVEAEVNELISGNDYDVIGLAGAVYGLAFVNATFDPTAGSYAAANSVSDLAATLASYQISGGGFTYNSTAVSAGNETNQETGYAILALNQVSRATYLTAIQGAATYLMSVQLGTGGWDDYVGDTYGENNELTGEAIWGIAAAYPPPVHNVTKDVYYPTIQGASSDASSGNSITAAAGTYNERVIISTSLSLAGAGETSTILDGAGLVGAGSGIIINSGVQNVTIQDLTVKNYAGTAPNSYAGIYAIGGNNGTTVQNVTLKDNVGGCGFYANGPVNGITLNNLDVSGHTNVFGAARGIVIWNGLKENVTITNCDVYNNNCCGIELQDGTASGVTMTSNNIHDNGDNGIGLVGLQGPGQNLINLNTLTNNGRFGIEVKNASGSGATTGAGRVVVEQNIVSRTTAIADLRDIVGIAAFRRSVLAGNVDVPTGVVIQNNTVTGYTQPSTSDGFGIVAEGMNHTITGNTVSGCDVGIQRQAGHLPYPGDGDQSNVADTYFGRGNSPVSCGITISGNILSNTIDTRDVGPGVAAGIVTNINSSASFCSIQAAINDAGTLSGHTLEVHPGTFSEQVLVNKSVTVKGVGASQPTVDFTGTVSGKPTLFDVSADLVTIDNLHFNVDMSKLRSAVIASAAGIDNITVKNNVVDAYGAPAGSFGDRNAVSVNYGGPTNYRVATGGVNSITFQNNTVNGSLPTSYFRSGLATDESGGTYTANTLQAISHDIIARFGSNGNITITGNNFNGGGLELDDMNAGAGVLTVSGNNFNGAFANVASPGAAVLRLQNNYYAKTTLVNGNAFTNHQWGVDLSNYNAVTLDNNTFTPLAGSTTFHHVAIDTKAISSNSASIVQVTVAAILTKNTFNGSGTPGGTALSFHNHDNDAASFGTFTIGTAGNENNFNAGTGNFILFDNQTGTSSGSSFPAYTSLIGAGAGALTTMAPWANDLNGRNNKFDVGTGLKLPAAMNAGERSSLETKLMHKPDDGTLGQIFTFDPVHNLTQSTFSPTIQNGIDNANPGDRLQVAAGTITEGPQIVVTKNISIAGVDRATTIIKPSGNTSNSGDARGWFLVNAGVTFNLSRVTLDGTGRLVYMGILNKGNGTIDSCTFMNMKYNESTEYAGIGMSVRETAHMNVNVTNSSFSGMGRIGLHYRGPGTTGTVSGNTFTGKGPGNWLDYGIEAGGAPLPEGGAHLTITNNTVSNCQGVATDGSTSAGILVTTYFGPGTQATITGCTLTDNTDGVAVGYDGADASVVVATNNTFGNNSGYGINSTNPYVDARHNYWGSIHGPSDLGGTIEVPHVPAPSVTATKNAVPATGLGVKVTDNNVDYFPWNGPGSAGALSGGIWAGGYVNPNSNVIFAGLDPAALDGVDPLDVVAPPPPPSDYLYLYFRTDPGQPIENYSIDIKKDQASVATVAKAWALKAITDHTSSLVTIEFPDAGLPTGFKPTIYDLAAGTHQNLRDNSTLTYTSPPTESVYSFRLLMGDSTKPAVAVTAPNGGEFLVVGTPYNITWTSSDGTGVLEHEVYYSLTGAAPYTLLATVNGSIHSYPWTPALASLNASVKVVARDSVMNEDFDVSNHTFTILASGSVSFNAASGWNLVSPPMLQGTMTPAAVFGDDYGATPYYTFQFSTTSGYSVPSTLNMGQGYWLGSNSAQVVDAVGTAQTSASLALGNGFNLIGDPFPAGPLKADLRFYNGVLTKDMTQAASAGWLSNVLYGYSGGSYFVESTTLGVWQGYWIPMLLGGITVQYSPSVAVPTPKEPVIANAAHWEVNLEATLTADGESFSDRIASFGVREDASAGFSPVYDAPRPPRSPAQGYIEVSFPAKDEPSAKMFGSSFARSFKTAANAAWEFTVNTSKEGVVTLAWDNSAISALPADVAVNLIDKANHTVIDMKRTGTYSYAQDGTSHGFVINKSAATDLPAVPSVFSLAQNYPNPFNPTSVIQFGLPADAVVFLEVYNSLGQKVATLLDGQSESAGYHQATFNAAQLSSGIYIYRLRAAGTDGTQFAQSHKMLLTK